MSAKDLLDRITVESPCDASWDSMIGNEQVRFCEHCNLTVHDLSQLTRKRALHLVRASKSRLCIRYQSRPDGTILTKSPSPELHRIARRASRIAAGAFSATLSLSSTAGAHSSPITALVSGSNLVSVEGRSGSSVQPLFSGASISGTITDQNGAVIPGAMVNISNVTTGQARVVISNDEGVYQCQGLEAGTYSLTIQAPGFTSSEIKDIVLQSDTHMQFNQMLEVGEIYATAGAMAMPEPSNPLVKAALEDDLQVLLGLLTRDNVNVRDKATGTTALEHAIQNGDREMVQVLLSTGADANSQNESKQTALMMMGEEATADIAWDLIHSGAKIHHKDSDGDTALIEAAMVNNVSVLNTLLQAGAKVNEKNEAGQTALMLAAANGLIKNVRALIAAGADLNARDKENKTSLSYANQNKEPRVVKLLLSYGAVEWIQLKSQ